MNAVDQNVRVLKTHMEEVSDYKCRWGLLGKSLISEAQILRLEPFRSHTNQAWWCKPVILALLEQRLVGF